MVGVAVTNSDNVQKKMHYFEHAVEPVYYGHPQAPQKVAVIER